MRLRSAPTQALLKARIELAEGLVRMLFERRLHIRTDGRIELADLGVVDDYRVHYQPSPWLTLPRILKRSEVSVDDVFIDFGCGMGRAVLEAAMFYRFARVIGVEVSEDLARVARENIDRNRRRLRTSEVQILTSDVLDYVVPDDVTIAYFYNPFYGPVFEHVIRQLLASVDRGPRRLRLIYQNPAEEGMLFATGRIRRIGSGRSFRPRGGPHRDLALYEVDLPPRV